MTAGLKSADQRVLNRIKKGVTVERMTKFTEDAKRAGVRIHGDFALGFPGETEESVRNTIDWACRIRPHTAQFQLMIPFPGTPFYDELKNNGWLKDGAPNYPHLSKERLELAAKEAYRKFYISAPYFLQIMKNPYEMFFSRIGTYYKALKYVLGGKYVR